MPINKPANIDQSVWDALDEVSKMRAVNEEGREDKFYEEFEATLNALIESLKV